MRALSDAISAACVATSAISSSLDGSGRESNSGFIEFLESKPDSAVQKNLQSTGLPTPAHLGSYILLTYLRMSRGPGFTQRRILKVLRDHEREAGRGLDTIEIARSVYGLADPGGVGRGAPRPGIVEPPRARRPARSNGFSSMPMAGRAVGDVIAIKSGTPPAAAARPPSLLASARPRVRQTAPPPARPDHWRLVLASGTLWFDAGGSTVHRLAANGTN
jgi:hypothetical protein